MNNLQENRETSNVGLTDLLGRLQYITESPSREHGGFHEQTIATARDALEVIGRMRSANDPRVVRIAKALAEGCDNRSSASDDAKWLHRRYEEWKDADPPASFTDARHRAFADFIVFVLGS